MIRIVKIVILLLITFFILIQCKQIPEPSEKNKTVFILPIKRSGETYTDFKGVINIKIINYKTNKVMDTLRIKQETGLNIITNLEPGKYTLSAQFITTTKNISNSTKDSSQVFELTEGFITISPVILDIIRITDRHSSSGISYFWSILSEDYKTKIHNEIQKMDNFSLWKMSI